MGNWGGLPPHPHRPANAVRVFAVVALRALVDVVEDHHAGNEVKRLARRQEVQVGPTVSPPVAVAVMLGSRLTHLTAAAAFMAHTNWGRGQGEGERIHPVQFQSLRGRLHFQVFIVLDVGRDVHGDWPAADEHFDRLAWKQKSGLEIEILQC